MNENNGYDSQPIFDETIQPPYENESQWALPHQSVPVYPMPYAAPPKIEPPLDQPWYGIEFVDAVKRFFKKYATFSGRASRGEYWWVFLATYIAAFALSIFTIIPIVGPLITFAFYIGILIPTLALSVRRLHDTNRSGLFLLIPFGLSIISGIVFFALTIPKIMEKADVLDTMSDDEVLEFLSTIFPGMGVALIIALIGTVVQIVLMAFPSNPEGVRFDKLAPIQSMAMPAQVFPQAYSNPSQTYAQPDYGQQPYGHSSTEQQLPTEQPPYSPM